ncbi:medium-chain acyl-CoA ligase ACSF2, mitochondrial-like isoform X1 [Branchiostoma lanceolatum]|uniref:medium-chain acyl-CoA ligase ACSF2, mitochondrial-like isoform X1 n=1 Tax=Branchiostoma lanceolatum TaxID=7740 RepID=UPI00345396DD
MSYLKSDCDLPLVEATPGQLLDDSAAKWPDQEAYVFRHLGVRMKLAEVKQEADRLAAGLLSIGVRRGDVVAWVLTNRPEWIISFFAAAKIGAISLPIIGFYFLTFYKGMVVDILKKAKVKVLLIENSPTDEGLPETIPYLKEVFPDIMSATTAKSLRIEAVPSLTSIVVIGDKTSDNALYNHEDIQSMGTNETARQRVQEALSQTNCHDTIILLLTSKVLLAPTDMTENLDSVLIPVLTGSQTVVFASANTWELADIISAILEERCEGTTFMYVKTLHDLVNDPTVKECDMSFLKDVQVGGNVISKTLQRQFAQVFPDADIINYYGTTEGWIVSMSTRSEMTKEQMERTVGRLMPHLETKVVNKAGQVVPLNQEGEIWVRGFSVFKGYRGDEEKTAKVKTHDGWHKTGDIGVLDEDGMLAITGRITDMIIKNAENVHPACVEQVLLAHPKVQDVKVVGVPDPRYVEEICACIILKNGQMSDVEEMRKFSEENGLLADEINPGYFVFMDSFPKTSTGRKIDKRRIRAVAMERLGLKENTD